MIRWLRDEVVYRALCKVFCAFGVHAWRSCRSGHRHCKDCGARA